MDSRGWPRTLSSMVLRCASEPEGVHAVGSYCVAQGALHEDLAGGVGGHRQACEADVRGEQLGAQLVEQDLLGGGTDGQPHSGLGSVGCCEHRHFVSRQLYGEDEVNHLLGLVQVAGVSLGPVGCVVAEGQHLHMGPWSSCSMGCCRVSMILLGWRGPGRGQPENKIPSFCIVSSNANLRGCLSRIFCEGEHGWNKGDHGGQLCHQGYGGQRVLHGGGLYDYMWDGLPLQGGVPGGGLHGCLWDGLSQQGVAQVGWDEREVLSLIMGSKKDELEAEEVAGTWVVEKVEVATEEGGLGRPGGPDEEHAVSLHKEILLPFPDVAHDALQLMCACC